MYAMTLCFIYINFAITHLSNRGIRDLQKCVQENKKYLSGILYLEVCNTCVDSIACEMRMKRIKNANTSNPNIYNSLHFKL